MNDPTPDGPPTVPAPGRLPVTRVRRLVPRLALGFGGAVAAGFLALCLRALS